MNRRTSLKLLVSGLIGLTIDPEELIWIPSRSRIFIPSMPISLYGIPYHQSNVSMGTWLGLTRESLPNLDTKRILESLINTRMDNNGNKKRSKASHS